MMDDGWMFVWMGGSLKSDGKVCPSFFPSALSNSGAEGGMVWWCFA
jgi:hypothetical protein